MSTLCKAIAFAALVAPACAALASTDCKSSAATVTIETGTKNSGYVVELSSGISFALKPAAVNYREILGTAQLSMMTGLALTARFAADGVRCEAKATRTDLIALVRGGEETTVVTPPSTSITGPIGGPQVPPHPGPSASAARP